jgi:hypothetical protein
MWALPQMLTRAGFVVDVITSSSLIRKCQFVRDCDLIPRNQSLLPAIIRRIQKNYDWIIVTEDIVLTEILESDLSLTDKLKILPVLKEENFFHLYSKIGLSQALSSQGVSAPPFVVAHNLSEALEGASLLGFPVLLKRDASGGGGGVFECKTPSELCSVIRNIFDPSFLIQKKLSGIEIDLSPLYLDGDLVHFSYATVNKICLNRFGPSSLRTYHSLSGVDAEIFRELAHIGKVLGLHGFTNTACIASEGRRFYFEVDVRPNVWVDAPKYFGEDPSIRIQKWFLDKEILRYPVPLVPNQPKAMRIPYFLRLKWMELVFGRYDVWKFIPSGNWRLIFALVVNHMLIFRMQHYAVSTIKKCIPNRYYKTARKLKSLCARKRVV